MALSTNIKKTIKASMQAASENTFSELDSTTLGELMKAGEFKTVSKVMLTRENKYKALVFRKADGSTACVMFGRNSATQVNIGDTPSKSWAIVLVSDDRGERLRISLGVETLGYDDLED